MFNIAIVKHGDLFQKEYIKRLEKKNQVFLFEGADLAQLIEQINDVDAVVVASTECNLEFFQNAETIMRIREKTKKHIWIVSKESTKFNRIIYFQLGCDGVFDESIDPEEFSIIIGSTLERNSYAGHASNKKKNIKEPQKIVNQINQLEKFKLIPTNFSVSISGKEDIYLTKLEYKVLNALYDSRGKALSYEELHQEAWGEKSDNKRYRIANLIFHLRTKLEDDSKQVQYIKTVRSKGYLLDLG